MSQSGRKKLLEAGFFLGFHNFVHDEDDNEADSNDSNTCDEEDDNYDGNIKILKIQKVVIIIDCLSFNRTDWILSASFSSHNVCLYFFGDFLLFIAKFSVFIFSMETILFSITEQIAGPETKVKLTDLVEVRVDDGVRKF